MLNLVYQRKTDRYYPTRDDVASWPAEHRRCSRCLEVKPFSEFNANKYSKWGVDNVCKECRRPKSAADYRKLSTERRLYQHAKSRATRRGIEFTITIEDVVVPEVCPVLGLSLQPGVSKHGDASPSLDRIDNAQGYVPGNVAVISHKANRLKGDATPEELQLLADWARGI